LIQAETFLRNRNWIVGSSINLREALAYIIQKKPQYILISSDHPNKKVRAMPKMLMQAFSVRVIGFAEKGTSNSTKNLLEMALEYNLYPPVSGPAIERMILKIRKDEELKSQNENLIKGGKIGDSGVSGNELITFKGETASANALKASFDQARMALSQLANFDGGGTDSEGAAHIPGSSSPMINFQQTGSSNTDPLSPAYRGSAMGGVGGGHIDTADSGFGYESATGGADPGRHSTSQGINLLSQSELGSTTPNGDDSGAPEAGADSQREAKQSSGMKGDANDLDVDSSGTGRGRTRKDGTPIFESEYAPKTAPKPYRMRQEKEPKNPDEKTSIFVQGAYQSLKQTVNLKGQETAEEISQSSNVACIQVQSPRFAGYLVCAMGRDRKIDKAFMDIIKQRLLRFLKESGEELKDKDTLNLKIQPIHFTDWALEQAEFLKKSVHDGDEIAIAFFPTQIQDPDLQSSVSEKMVMIHMNELKDDAPVEFDLYIFMPENNKYLLYTPQGRPFYGKQKVRLKDKGITHMHLRKEAAPNVQKYRAQNFLNDKISAYRSGKKASG
jgi:hypothetical protein